MFSISTHGKWIDTVHQHENIIKVTDHRVKYFYNFSFDSHIDEEAEYYQYIPKYTSILADQLGILTVVMLKNNDILSETIFLRCFERQREYTIGSVKIEKSSKKFHLSWALVWKR